MKNISVNSCALVVPYQFPKKAYFGRVVPKTKIYKNATPTAKVKRAFVQDVAKIIWSYKLSPETINIPASDSVSELQVFTIVLKHDTLNHDILRTIDRAIPSPILFVLSYEHKIQYVMAYKRPSESDKTKVVVSGYFESEWISEETETQPLPVSLDMNTLYQQMIKELSPLPPRDGESVELLVDRVEQWHKLKRQADKLDVRLKKEKQFNRKVEINQDLKNLNKQILEMEK